MSDSKQTKEKLGFSTGALERGNFRSAIAWLTDNHVQSVELSALRIDELEPLVDSLNSFSFARFSYVSFHAPSSFAEEDEKRVVEVLGTVATRGWNLIVHPDVIRTYSLWRPFGSLLLIENMDRRKSVGRTVDELEQIFNFLPNARLCLDVAHARQMDTTLTLLSQIISKFSNRIAEIHISELDSWCQHQPMSDGAVRDYQNIAKHISSSLPVIIESMLEGERTAWRMDELQLARKAMRHRYNGTGMANSETKTLRKEFVDSTTNQNRDHCANSWED